MIVICECCGLLANLVDLTWQGSGAWLVAMTVAGDWYSKVVAVFAVVVEHRWLQMIETLAAWVFTRGPGLQAFDAHEFYKSSDRYQRTGNISERHKLPWQNILEVELFNVWGIDFMRPFPSSFGDLYILLEVNYVSKWIEAIETPKNDSKIGLKFLHKNIFTQFGTPRAIISDEGTHFDKILIAKALKRYRVRHRIAMTYHPQTNGQAEVSNREIKHILEKVVNLNRKDWSPKLDEAL
ncbi:uncharacterized protein LOC120183094 [Hibiscus syriacus]|uniref:uncharacterized protein LOC120183094 n=1 Tax=Hibiscus syriacus TaxID=106335 RepID=UPI001921D4B4|nr:uncharacterized protein LOC120183094 [Hibiscus syriacus]